MRSKCSKAIRLALALASASAGLIGLQSVAHAQGVDEFGPYGYDHETTASEQNMAVELRLGPYRPNIDEEFAGSGQTPYADHFGNGRRWLLGMEIDWELLKIPDFGTFGPGAGIGFTKMTGHTFLANGEEADQTTKLSIIPMYVDAVLRVDQVAKATPVPLVPYAKLGLGYALWSTNNGVGVPKAKDGSKGDDTSWGLNWSLGLMFLLDCLDQQSANALDGTHGVNHSYVFLEWYNSELNGFGSGNQMHVGTNTWMTGIALEL
ncbi:MAG TPA: MXAN_2562 family outer membrane beta-barrel protein [Polyangiaceae bacterium]|nr:MXAN_2562 family outer membrane beta-barrel protein [Polyangiaceae bacterium]